MVVFYIVVFIISFLLLFSMEHKLSSNQDLFHRIMESFIWSVLVVICVVVWVEVLLNWRAIS